MSERMVVPIHGEDHCPGGPDPIPCLETEPAGAVPAEWIGLVSTTNFAGTGATVLSFSEIGGDYDLVTPTFEVSGGNLLIAKGGVYTVDTGLPVTPSDGSGTTHTHMELAIYHSEGPIPTTAFHDWTEDVGYPVLKTLYWPGDPFNAENGWPFFHDVIALDMDDDFTPPLQVRVTGRLFWGGIQEASADPVVRMIVVRIGDAFNS